MPRAQWKGYLRLSLVTIAVELHSATERGARLELHQIDKKSGKRIRYEKTVPGKGSVEKDEIVRGFELDNGRHVMLTPEELDKLKLETRHTIDLVQFTDQCEIDPRYFEKPYYLLPAGGDVAAEGYAVIREALRQSGKAGIGQMTIRGKESLVAVKACGDGLLLETLRYADELKESDKVFKQVSDARPQKDMVELAIEIIEKKSSKFKPEEFKDHYGEALKALVAEKKKHGKITDGDEDEPKREDRGNVIDLMEALRKSVGGKAKEKEAKPAKKAAKKRAKG